MNHTATGAASATTHSWGLHTSLLLCRYLQGCHRVTQVAHKQRTTLLRIAPRPLMPGSTHPRHGPGGTHAGRTAAGAHPAHAPHAVPRVLWVCSLQHTDAFQHVADCTLHPSFHTAPIIQTLATLSPHSQCTLPLIIAGCRSLSLLRTHAPTCSRGKGAADGPGLHVQLSTSMRAQAVTVA